MRDITKPLAGWTICVEMSDLRKLVADIDVEGVTATVHDEEGRMLAALPVVAFEKPEWEGRTANCKICNVERKVVAPGDTQGDDCASAVFKRDGAWFLIGCYGSGRFDMDLYRFKYAPPDIYRNADPVCDDCVQKLIDVEFLEQVPGTYL